VKYLILGALSSAFMVYGMRLSAGWRARSISARSRQSVRAGAQINCSCLGVLFVWPASASRSRRSRSRSGFRTFYQGRPDAGDGLLAVGSKRQDSSCCCGAVQRRAVIRRNGPHAHGHRGRDDPLRKPLAIPQRGLKRLLAIRASPQRVPCCSA